MNWSIVANVILVILLILVVVLAVLYFLGRKMEKRQVEQQSAIDAAKQTVSLMAIDKKKLKIKEAGLPPLTDDRLNQMASDIYNEYGSTLLYGPVAIPEFDSEVYGFLAADGDNLEDVWYGIWHAPLEDQTFPITKITLFD